MVYNLRKGITLPSCLILFTFFCLQYSTANVLKSVEQAADRKFTANMDPRSKGATGETAILLRDQPRSNALCANGRGPQRGHVLLERIFRIQVRIQ